MRLVLLGARRLGCGTGRPTASTPRDRREAASPAKGDSVMSVMSLRQRNADQSRHTGQSDGTPCSEGVLRSHCRQRSGEAVESGNTACSAGVSRTDCDPV